MIVSDLGRMPYSEAFLHMEAVREGRIAGELPDTLLLVEHDPVYTVGRTRGAEAKLEW